MKLLIDADSLIYKAGCANETREYLIQDKETGIVVHSCQYKAEATSYVGEDVSLEIVFTKRAGDLSHSLGNMKQQLDKIRDMLRHTSAELFIGGKGNFRYALYPDYKGTRDPVSRPIHEQELRDYLIRTHKATVCDGEEADDVVSYLCCADPEGTTIVGIDKDLWGTPGHHLNPDKGTLEQVSLESANEHFWHQMLTGDTSDNIPCLAGVGPKTADKLINDPPPWCNNLADVVYQKYLELGHDENYFNLMGQLLWLRRKPNQVWTPELAV